ncbi:MAG: hypothetical protein JWM73_3068 [Solirubrobacterales bacterium]|nr:hypothetical protein [Solirubrobacterales bacterium]
MRVLVLTPYLYGTAPGPRSSIELWERVLEPAGIQLDYAAFESDRLHRIIYRPNESRAKAAEMVRCYGRQLGTVGRLSDYDAALIYREAALIGPALIERLAARKVPLIYQLDDPLYVPYRSIHNGYLSYLKFFGKVRSIAGLSAVTVVNSPQHAEYVAPHARRIVEVPSVVDADTYTYVPPEREPGSPVTIGWSGSSTTVGNLQVIEPVLRELGARDDVRLKFIGGGDFGLPRVAHEAQQWSAATEIDDLRSLDIGLLPLPDNPWNRRKFYLKLVQYMALGIPAVCTPLGTNPQVVDHGETGFLAETLDDWRALLGRLIDEPELRRDMGRRAAEEAQRHYTLQANADKIVSAFAVS